MQSSTGQLVTFSMLNCMGTTQSAAIPTANIRDREDSYK